MASRAAPAHTPLRSLLRIASVAEHEPEGPDPDHRGDGLELGGRRPAVDDRLADPVDDEAERVVLGDPGRRLEHQVGGEEGVREEEDHEDQGEDPLDDAGAVRARSAIATPIVPNARAEAEVSSDDPEHGGHALVDRRAEDQPERDEVDGDQRAEHRRGREPAERRSTSARSVRREAVREPHLDVDREGDRRRSCRSSSATGRMAPASMKERKLGTCGKPGRSTARPAPAVWMASRAVGKMSSGASELWAAQRLQDGAPPEGGDHAGVRRSSG